MADKNNAKESKDSKPGSEYKAPAGKRTKLTFQSQSYQVTADWMVLRKREKPIAEMFHTAYLRDRAKAADRPVTFVFNGGPGAASAYLHLGALGPKRVAFARDGKLPSPPARLVENKESWLAFTDLVFIDPIGTGLSRTIDEPKEPKPGEKPEPPPENQEFYQLNRDLDSIGECIQRFLSKHKRWSSPVYIAGESYGGFRVAKLARRLQESFGVGLAGAFLISPALEFSGLNYSDYNITPWIEVFPSLAASAWQHGRSPAGRGAKSLAKFLPAVEDFTMSSLLNIVSGAGEPGSKSFSKIIDQMSDFCGISAELLQTLQGRLSLSRFSRELLRDQGLYCGVYDASVTAEDPFPDREHYNGPDPTLASIDRVFSGGINILVREVLGLDTDRIYHLLSWDVNSNWKLDYPHHPLQTEIGATDDLRYGIALNPDMRVFIAHGYYDLVTPYFASQRIVNLMKLNKQQRARVTLENYRGGHMFYTWDESREHFFKSVRAAYR